MDIDQLRERLSSFKGRHKKSEALLKSRATERREAETAHAIELSKERTLNADAQQRARTLQEKLDEANEGCAKAERENKELRGENKELRGKLKKLRSENEELHGVNEDLRDKLEKCNKLAKSPKRKARGEDEDEDYAPKTPKKTPKKSTSGKFIKIHRSNEFEKKGGSWKHSVSPRTYLGQKKYETYKFDSTDKVT